MPGEYLKVLSWNIQKFGVKKLNDPNFLRYVSRVIIDSGADFVGIMEIVGWQGTDIKQQLLSVLNNHTAGSSGNWRGAESEMTPSRPNEQYLFLREDDPVRKMEISLYGIIDDNAFDAFFKKHPAFYNSANNTFNQQAIANFWDALKKKGYLDDDYIVPNAERVQLVANTNYLDLTPDINLNAQQKQDVVDILISEDVINFPYSGSRPPFLAKLTLQPNDTEMLVVLFHAPGPGSSWPMIACSNLGLIPNVRDVSKSLIMGDFNVKHNQYSQQYTLYNRGNNGQLVAVQNAGATVTAQPFQRLTGPAIAGAIDMPQGKPFYTKVLNNHPTSLTSTTLTAPIPNANNANTRALRSSTYDNFYCRGNLNNQKNERVVPLIAQMVPPGNNNNITIAQANQAQANLAIQVFNTWWTQQNNRGVKKPDIINPNKAGDTIRPINNQNPLQSLREAHYIYRYAISDHLPIYMEYEYE